MSRLVRVFLILAAVMLTTLVASSPSLATGMPYAGRLTDAGGSPITGARDLTITLYDGSNNVLYSETFTAVSITNGLFNIEIGNGTPVTGTFAGVNFNSYDVYLGITVGTDAEMTPRVHLGFSPYSLSSLTSPGMSASHVGSSNFAASGVATLASTSITIPRDGVIIVMVEGQLFLASSSTHNVWISESNSGFVDNADYGIVNNPAANGGFFQFSRFRVYRKTAGSYSFFCRGDSAPAGDYIWEPNMVALFIPLQMGPVSPSPAASMVPVRQPGEPTQQPAVAR